jgi:hypothetical protein
MELVYANVESFEEISYRHIPHLTNDVIGILRTPEDAAVMRKLKPGDQAIYYTVNHLTNFDYIVMTSKHIPRYSTIDIEFGHLPIKITDDIQEVLKNAVANDDRELSGMINRDGSISRLIYGTGIKAPYQEKSTFDQLSFHTHPVYLYDTHNTNVGWPSTSDVLLTRNDKHVVASYEGLYIMNTGGHGCTPPSKKGVIATSELIIDTLSVCRWILLPWGKEWCIY